MLSQQGRRRLTKRRAGAGAQGHMHLPLKLFPCEGGLGALAGCQISTRVTAAGLTNPETGFLE